jgi:hypothetical protein
VNFETSSFFRDSDGHFVEISESVPSCKRACSAALDRAALALRMILSTATTEEITATVSSMFILRS